MIKVGIYGATGYTGYEAVKILTAHPEAEVSFATSERYSGKRLSDVFACEHDLPLIPSLEAPLSQLDVVFLCLPHRVAMGFTKERIYGRGVRIIDLSADFRFDDAASYERWYRTQHVASELLREAVYGLPELYRDQIKGAELVANPGCYPTAVILGLCPLAEGKYLSEGAIIVDAKSGVSGAGRTPSERNLFVEVNENIVPYSIGHVHRHIGEMEQELAKLAGRECRVIFAPHLLPVNQGILCTIYVKLTEAMSEGEVVQIYRERFGDEKFVMVLEGKPAHLRYVYANNKCTIGIKRVDEEGNFIITSAIDNLIKGASGQAVQNMNIMFGLAEDCGLR